MCIQTLGRATIHVPHGHDILEPCLDVFFGGGIMQGIVAARGTPLVACTLLERPILTFVVDGVCHLPHVAPCILWEP
jgi:hypothetical protein